MSSVSCRRSKEDLVMTLRRSIHLALLAAGSIAAAGAPSVHAQDSKPASAMVLEEIIVTAQKRLEGLQDVPVALTAFTDATREMLGIETIQDMTNYTPGVVYFSSVDRMFVRGIGRSSNNLSVDPAVATYRDGFYSSFNREADSSSLFIERVEILRGPQGTLYGRNSIGGALNLVSRRPTDEWSGEVRAEVGDFDKQVGEGT